MRPSLLNPRIDAVAMPTLSNNLRGWMAFCAGPHSGVRVRMHLLTAVIALAPLPALAQSIASAEKSDTSNATPATTSIQQAAPSTTDRSAEDAQLPAYLQANPQSDSASAAFDPWERYNRR